MFAIAVTLLVLELKVPVLGTDKNSAALAKALLQQWPGYVGLVTSFFRGIGHVGASPCDSPERLRDLHGVVDFLGNDDYEEYAGVRVRVRSFGAQARQLRATEKARYQPHW